MYTMLLLAVVNSLLLIGFLRVDLRSKTQMAAPVPVFAHEESMSHALNREQYDSTLTRLDGLVKGNDRLGVIGIGDELEKESGSSVTQNTSR